MDKTAVPLDNAYRLINPGCVALVSVGDGERDNLFPVAWNTPAGKEPPLVALVVGRGHFSYPFIERTGELGLNVPGAALADAVLGCGTTSGRDVPDKFARFGLERQPPREIRAPLVQQALANLECRVVQLVDLGKASLVVARVLCAVAAREHFVDGRWHFADGLQLLHHLGGDHFCTSERSFAARLSSG